LLSDSIRIKHLKTDAIEHPVPFFLLFSGFFINSHPDFSILQGENGYCISMLYNCRQPMSCCLAVFLLCVYNAAAAQKQKKSYTDIPLHKRKYNLYNSICMPFSLLFYKDFYKKLHITPPRTWKPLTG